MELKEFLRLLRIRAGITIQFSHLGYVVLRNSEVLDSRGNHSHVKPITRDERIRKVGNMYSALASACRYMPGDLRLLVGDLLACMANDGGRN